MTGRWYLPDCYLPELSTVHVSHESLCVLNDAPTDEQFGGLRIPAGVPYGIVVRSADDLHLHLQPARHDPPPVP